MKLFKFILILAILSSQAQVSAEPKTTKEQHSSKETRYAPVTGEKYPEARQSLYTAYPKFKEYFGFYRPDRVHLHDQVISKYFESSNAVSHFKPQIIWTMGAYGSGKGYVLKKMHEMKVLNIDDYVIIDPDKIKELLPEYIELSRKGVADAGTLVHHESGYIANIVLEQALKEGRNIIIDGSLRYEDWFNDMFHSITGRYPEYQTHLVDVRLNKAKMIERVNQRNKEERRKVSLKEAREVYEDLMHIRHKVYDRFDSILQVDNSNEIPVVRSIYYHGQQTSVSLPLTSPKRRGEKFSLKNYFQMQKYSSLAKNKKFMILFDIDWTLVYFVKKELAGRPDVFRVGNDYYRLSDFAREVISNLSDRKNVQVGFYSGGGERRNQELLEAIKLNDGSNRSLLDLAEGRVFSKPHLVDRDLNNVLDYTKVKFWHRFGKDVRIAGNAVEDTLIVEDIKGFTIAGQEANVAFLGDTYNYFETWDEAKNVTPDPRSKFIKIVPANETEHLLERHKLVWQLGMIDLALEIAENENIPLRDSYSKLAKDNYGQFSNRSKMSNVQFYKRGFNQMGLSDEIFSRNFIRIAVGQASCFTNLFNLRF